MKQTAPCGPCSTTRWRWVCEPPPPRGTSHPHTRLLIPRRTATAGLLFSQLVFTAVLVTKRAAVQAALMVPLMAISYWVLTYMVQVQYRRGPLRRVCADHALP